MLKDCPHANVTARTMTCALVPDILIPAPSETFGRCRQCQSEWAAPDTPPTLDTPTPTILELIELRDFRNSEAPGAIQMAANFATAVVDHAAGGFERVTQPEYDARLAVCTGSESGEPCIKFEPKQKRCLDGGCGCFLEVKAWWKEQQCPLGKWPKEATKTAERIADAIHT